MPVLADQDKLAIPGNRDDHDARRGIHVEPVAPVPIRHYEGLADEPLRLGHQDLTAERDRLAADLAAVRKELARANGPPLRCCA